MTVDSINRFLAGARVHLLCFALLALGAMWYVVSINELGPSMARRDRSSRVLPPRLHVRRRVQSTLSTIAADLKECWLALGGGIQSMLAITYAYARGRLASRWRRPPNLAGVINPNQEQREESTIQNTTQSRPRPSKAGRFPSINRRSRYRGPRTRVCALFLRALLRQRPFLHPNPVSSRRRRVLSAAVGL